MVVNNNNKNQGQSGRPSDQPAARSLPAPIVSPPVGGSGATAAGGGGTAVPPGGPPTAPLDPWDDVDPQVPAPSPTWTARLKANLRIQQGRASNARAHGLSEREYERRATDRLRNLLQLARPCIAVLAEAIPAIVQDGRFRNQFETGTSGGAPLSARAPLEDEMMGLPYPEVPGADRPKYGFLSTDPAGPAVAPIRQTYGDVVVVFKDDVRPSTTFCTSDSLDENFQALRTLQRPIPRSQRRGPSTRPSPINAPDLDSHLYPKSVYGPRAADPLDARRVEELMPRAYVEAQYWGPLRVADIEEAHIDSRTPEGRRARALLVQAGVKVIEAPSV